MADRPDQLNARCSWTGNDPLYIAYHDAEWGVPCSDSRQMFEKLVLESFQSGLSWITILRKRDNFRAAFADFKPERIANYSVGDIERLMSDSGIVRNRRKIKATINNAKAYLKLSERQSFANYMWGFLADGPIINTRQSMADVPGQTPLSQTIAKALKHEGFGFVGPTTVYAFMQSLGMVNDHIICCPRHSPCAALQRQFKLSDE